MHNTTSKGDIPVANLGTTMPRPGRARPNRVRDAEDKLCLRLAYVDALSHCVRVAIEEGPPNATITHDAVAAISEMSSEAKAALDVVLAWDIDEVDAFDIAAAEIYAVYDVDEGPLTDQQMSELLGRRSAAHKAIAAAPAANEAEIITKIAALRRVHQQERMAGNFADDPVEVIAESIRADLERIKGLRS